MEDIYTMSSHGGEDSPGIFPRNIYMPCVITGVSFLTRIIPLGNMYTPCVITGARTRRVYILIRNINAVCNHGGEFPHLDYSLREYAYSVCNHGGEDTPGICLYGIYIYTPRVVTGVSIAHQNYSFTERALAVCTQCNLG